MNSTAQLPIQSGLGVSGANSVLHDLAAAAQRLISTLWANAVRRPIAAVHALTAFEDAENMRQMADGFLRNDPNFAQDLYGAADRHERSNGV